jgi:hypothetical protein
MTASLDLSLAYDLVNVDLLILSLKIVGLPDDIIELLRAWLSNRTFYGSIHGVSYLLFDLLIDTVQGLMESFTQCSFHPCFRYRPRII